MVNICIMYSVCSQTAQPSHEALHEAAAGGGERAPDGVRAGGAELGPAQPHLPAGSCRGWRGCWPHLPARARHRLSGVLAPPPLLAGALHDQVMLLTLPLTASGSYVLFSLEGG